MRTVTRLNLGDSVIEPVGNGTLEEANIDLIVGLLREARLVAPASNLILTAEQILAAWRDLELATAAETPKPTDPESRAIVDVAKKHTLDQSVGITDPDQDFRYKAMRHALSILAQMPGSDEEAESPTDLVYLLHARDPAVFGLLFRVGGTFTIRWRHSERDHLRSVTERVVNVLAPRGESEIDDLARDLHKVHRVRRFAPKFEKVLMKTPKGEVAQSGEVHSVTSQFGLLKQLALESPQIYLVFLTAVLMLANLALETRLVGDATLRDLSLRTWMAGNLARLGTGAFGAYLVALFLRFAELRTKLGGAAHTSTRGKQRFGRRRAYGAFIHWQTD